MNAGILTIWVMTVLAILVATGWRAWLVGEVTLKRLVIMASGLVISLPFTIRLSEDINLHASALWMVCWAATTVRMRRSPGQAILLFFGSILAAVSWYVLQRLYQLDPVFILMHPAWDAILITGLFAGLLTWRFEEQLFVLVLSLVIADTALAQARAYPVVLGNWSWWDRLLCAVVIARLTGAGCILLSHMRIRWQARHLQDQGGGHS